MYETGNAMVLMNFRLTQEGADVIRKLAHDRGISVSEWLRQAVERMVAAEGLAEQETRR